MASWTTPKTYVAGSALTAAELNTYLTGNTQWVKDALENIGVTSDSTIPQLKSAIYGVQAYNTGTQSTTNGTTYSVNLSSETFDSDGFHDTVTNNTRLTVPAGGGGVYHAGYTLSYAANATGIRRATLNVNGSPVPWGENRSSAASSNETVLSASAIWHGASAGDFLTLTALQTSGGSLNITSAYLWMYRISAS